MTTLADVYKQEAKRKEKVRIELLKKIKDKPIEQHKLHNLPNEREGDYAHDCLMNDTRGLLIVKAFITQKGKQFLERQI